MNSKDVRELLKLRYAAPEWAIYFEVANATGGVGSRYADAVAMNMWPSRGLSVHGFEIKVSKSDFVNEIRNPKKSEAVQKYCDFWWIVAPKEAVDTSLLPENWGWLQAYENRLVCQKQAPKLEALPMDRNFAASMIRRAMEADVAVVKEAVDKALRERHEWNEKRIKSEIESRTKSASEALKTLNELKTKLGDHSWRTLDVEETVRAVRLVRESGVLDTYSGLQGLRNTLTAQVKQLDEALSKFLVEQPPLPFNQDESDLNEALQ